MKSWSPKRRGRLNAGIVTLIFRQFLLEGIRHVALRNGYVKIIKHGGNLEHGWTVHGQCAKLWPDCHKDIKCKSSNEAASHNMVKLHLSLRTFKCSCKNKL